MARSLDTWPASERAVILLAGKGKGGIVASIRLLVDGLELMG